MTYFRRSKFIRFVIVPLMLVAFLPACYKWAEIETTAESELPNPARITPLDGQQFVLEDAKVTGDSLLGRPKGNPRPVIGEELGVRIVLTDVHRFEKAAVG